MKQRKDESAIDYLRRVVGILNYEQDSILQSLPSIEAVIDYARLWDDYDSDLMEGIQSEIINREANPKKLIEFIDKYKLDWDKSWMNEYVKP